MLYCSNCGKIIKPKDIWYLFDNKHFYQRILEIGVCPKCKRDLAALSEINKDTCKAYIDRQYGHYAGELIDKCITQLWYRQRDLIAKKGRPYGYIYGENREHRDGIVVYACDFFGNKEKLPQKM